ncbi:Predicted oxidoreductase [Ectothiorhodosinus mongolicus]|uniref:Predicted oxidoreductase n=1 Tax=Ectothiorhodosinus mongolicus TaxID=233100 RepID=A0A1R3VRX4_9GAMM|nr:aldo/keto reductase [Ectothiorhodosinus mongolicus]ULX56575.1 aldo/keto reductase [Ectothiorhodosinus mongolicus]SIT66380.1 Predicted oxidoreductase [Ectothiorhodosinus mongolicus]
MLKQTDPLLIPGFATRQGTEHYAQALEEKGLVGGGHFSEFPREHLKLSSIGAGSFGGEASGAVDACISAIVAQALQAGINVIDTGAHYRYGRSLAAVGAGVRTAIQAGVPREAMFLISKGGFLTLRGGPPEDMTRWFDAEIISQGLGTQEQLAGGVHLLSPEYIHFQLELSRHLMGVETLDGFLIDQPEVQIAERGKEATNRMLEPVFEVLERAVQENRLRFYGISTFEGFRVETDAEQFQSLTSMIGLAERAAQSVTGEPNARHHFRLASLPFNQVMLEGFTRFNTATGKGNVASALQAAYQLQVYMLASHGMLKGHLAKQSVDSVERALPNLSNPAQRSLQFNRSAPGVGTALVGMSTPNHLEDVLVVAKRSPMARQAYLALFQKAEE